MKLNTLRKYRTFTYDPKGKPLAVTLNLKNPKMRSFFETLMEDFEDTLVAMERQDEEGIPWETVKANLEAKRKA